MNDAQLAQLGDAYIDLIAATFPTTATLLGIHDYDGELGKFTEETMIDLGSSLRGLRRDVAAGDQAALSQHARIDRAFLLHALDSALLEVNDTQWWRRNPEFAIDTALVGLYF